MIRDDLFIINYEQFNFPFRWSENEMEFIFVIFYIQSLLKLLL